MRSARLLLSFLCSVAASQLPAADPLFDDTFNEGPEIRYEAPDTPAWREQQGELPAYPEQLDELLPLNISTGGSPYRIYLDPASVTVGGDGVVRFTSVLISSSGVWNVTYEGMRCGEMTWRRLAYGSGGRWHRLDNAAWTRIDGRGMNRYRKLLYQEYLCELSEQDEPAGVLIRKLRNRDIFTDAE